MDENRIIWAAARSALESSQKKNKRNGSTGVRHWELFEKLLSSFIGVLKVFRLYQKGLDNALAIQLKSIKLQFPSLPPSFNGLRILHLTDLHLDGNPAIIEVIHSLLEQVTYDICFITGDFRMENHGSVKAIFSPLRQLIAKINPPLGIYATLGNHDSYLMVDELEQMGIKILTNETIAIKKGNDEIIITGIDDVHYYFTDNAIKSMEFSPQGFKIALVHSPEMYDIALQNNYDLYLCGHTHGGQICLPGGKPVFKHLYNGSDLIKGLWQKGTLTGYTSQGCGTSGIPIRFNSISEITIFELKK